MKTRYPCTLDCQGSEIVVDLVLAEDEAAVLAFARILPVHDLLFLSRDIQQPKVVSAWIRDITAGEILSLSAKQDGKIVAVSAIVIDRLSWSAHVGELRILVGAGHREIGLGRALIQQCFLMGLDLGLEKLTARMTGDQDRAITVFEEMGFTAEALLKDHVKDQDGLTHDIVLMSHDVARLGAQMQAYGLDEAF